MLRTIAFAVLIGFICTAATAQQRPSPSPPPAEGTREFTAAAFDRYNQAEADYAAVAAKPDASLRDLEIAYYAAEPALKAALDALSAEAEKSPEVRDAKFKAEVAESTYNRIDESRYETKELAKAARNKARKEYERKLQARKELIQSALGTKLPWTISRSARHYDLLEAKEKADKEAAKARWEKKKAQEQQPEPKKTSCAPGSGITGLTENIACQEQHSGSGH